MRAQECLVFTLKLLPRREGKRVPTGIQPMPCLAASMVEVSTHRRNWTARGGHNAVVSALDILAALWWPVDITKGCA